MCSDWGRCSVFGLGQDSGSRLPMGSVGWPKPKLRGSKGAPYWAGRGASMGAVGLTEVENWTGAMERGRGDRYSKLT